MSEKKKKAKNDDVITHSSSKFIEGMIEPGQSVRLQEYESRLGVCFDSMTGRVAS